MGPKVTLVLLVGVMGCGEASPSGREPADADEPITCQVTGSTDPCPSGTYCADGLCRRGDCVHFFAGGCASDQQCAPIGNGVFTCVPVGFAALLASCGADLDCVAGALCLRGICLAPECTPFSAYVACSGAEVCTAITRAGEALDLGLCE